MTAHTSNNLAIVADLRNRPEAALSLFRSALLAYQRLGDRRGTAQTYHNLGLAFRQVGEWGEAESAALQAVRHAEQVGEGGLLALTLSGRAELHLKRGQFDLARRELERAAFLAGEANDEVGLAEAKRIEALLLLREGNAAAAAVRAADAAQAAVRLGALQIQAESSAIQALALRTVGRSGEAEAHRAEAVAMFGRLGAEGLRARFEEEWKA
jgi:tetratricopeptide (TPR) repeat protein